MTIPCQYGNNGNLDPYHSGPPQGQRAIGSSTFFTHGQSMPVLEPSTSARSMTDIRYSSATHPLPIPYKAWGAKLILIWILNWFNPQNHRVSTSSPSRSTRNSRAMHLLPTLSLTSHTKRADHRALGAGHRKHLRVPIGKSHEFWNPYTTVHAPEK